MLRLSFAVLLGAALFAGVAAKSDAAARLRGNKVSISGCTSVGPPVCTLIMIKSGKQVYMTLVGEKAGDVSICFHPVLVEARGESPEVEAEQNALPEVIGLAWA
jgi:hypothetical protein